MKKYTNRPKRLAMLALMAVLGLNFSSCGNDTDKPPVIIPELKVTVTVSGSASKDGKVSAEVGLSMDKDPGADTVYVIENHTPEVCSIEPMQIEVGRDDWQSSQTIIVTGIDNGTPGSHECRFTVKLNDKDGNELTSASGVVIIEDNPVLPDIEINVVVKGNASEDGQVTADVELSMNRNPGSDTVYVIENHTTEVCNIEPMAIEVDKDDWRDTQIVVVSGIPNGVATGNLECRFTVRLNDEDGNELASKPGVVIIEDQESPGLHIVGDSKYTSEDGTSMTFEVWLHTQPTAAVTVTVTSSLVTEGVLVDKAGNAADQIILTFTPENWEQRQTITVMGVPDGVVDGDRDYESIFVVASDDERYDGYRATRPLVNIDIDVPGLAIAGDITNIIVSESGTTAELPIMLTAVPIGPVTVHIASSNTDEAIVSVSTLTFMPENWNVPQIVIVTGVPDDIDDGDQAFTITITASGSFFDSAEPVIVHGINENIDVAGIVVTKESDIIIVSEAGITSAVEVVLTSKPTAPVTITLTVDDRNVATTSPTHLTFTPENWNVTQMFVVHGVDNSIVDGHRPFVIDLTVTSEDPKYHGAFIPPIHGICLDDDADAEVHVNPWTVFITSDSLSATFTVTLTADPEESITFPLSVEAIGVAAGFKIDKTALSFSSANWRETQVVTVSIAAGIPEAYGSFFVEIGRDSSATGIYQDVNPSNVVVAYDFRDPCLEPSVLSPGVYKLEVWGAQGGWTRDAYPQKYYECGDKDAWINQCVMAGLEVQYGEGACTGYDNGSGSWQDGWLYENWCNKENWFGWEGHEAWFMAMCTTQWGGSAEDCKRWYEDEKRNYDRFDTSRGGYASGILRLTEETKVWRCEGGQGEHSTPFARIAHGGKNGGGNSGRYEEVGRNSGGGGGSDIRIGMNTLYHRAIVAGGGGGNGRSYVGGRGGGWYGYDGGGEIPGQGGNPMNGGASVGYWEYPNSFSQAGGFGYGGAASALICWYYQYCGGSGGGGGWFGGSGGSFASGGGGGSGYVLTSGVEKPAGYALGSQYYLTSAVSLDGRQVMPAPGGGTQAGQRLDGVARISKCNSTGNHCVVCPGGVCPE